jgi:phage terminase small subunit
MPALRNKRWERFCQLIVFGDVASQKQAYIEAGYQARNNAAEVNASKLLRITKPVIDRVRELQEEQKAKLEQRDRFTRDTIAKRMALASKIAEEDRNPNALYGAELAIAKLYNLMTDKIDLSGKPDFSQAKSMQDVGRKLLQSVGFREPDDASIAAAIEANDVFIDRLTAIRDKAQALTIDRDD